MNADTAQGRLAALLGPYLARQPWYWAACNAGRPAAGTVPAGAAEPQLSPADVSVHVMELLPPPGPQSGLARLVVHSGACRLQVVLAWREATAAAAVLRGRDSAILGTLTAAELAAGDLAAGTTAAESPAVGDLAGHDVLVYDAMADEEMTMAVLSAATAGKESARRARVVESLTSHSSIVFDERLFMKLYRVLVPAPRPEVEIMLGLDEAGFNHIVAPVALWRRDGYDLALTREFYGEAAEGRTLALTSLRDLLGGPPVDEAGPTDRDIAGGPAADPAARAAAAGGDMASEMRRLGDTTARMHEALARAFGSGKADLVPIACALEGSGAAEGAVLAARLRSIGDPGAAIRVHGDYHLRRVMRSDMGWLVVGFGDDPSRFARLGPDGRGALGGLPADDLADMLLSIRAVAGEATAGLNLDDSSEVMLLAGAWVERNSAAFLDGYLAYDKAASLLPANRQDLQLMVEALELLRVRRAGPAGEPA